LEKLVNLVGFIIRIYHKAQSPELQRQTNKYVNIYHLTEQHLIYYFASNMLHLFHSL